MAQGISPFARHRSTAHKLATVSLANLAASAPCCTEVVHSSGAAVAMATTLAHASTQTAPEPPSQQEPLEARILALKVDHMREAIQEEERQANQVRFEEMQMLLEAARRASIDLRTELELAQHAEVERSSELVVALAGLQEAQKQLAGRDKDCTHWRIESARAVERLETLTAHCERQNDRIKSLEAEVETLFKTVEAARADSLVQREALLASEQARTQH